MASGQQLIKSDRGSMLTMSDDNVMMKQIVGTHAPDGRETSQAHAEMEDKTYHVNFVSMLDALSYTIDRISSEIAYKALDGTDAHATTVSLFNMLTSYSWDAKLVLTLTAFALNYGEFWLLAQIYSSNELAKSMAILRQLPSIIEQSGPLKPRFDAINNLIKVMMDVARCVVEFKDLPPAYISNEVPALSTAMAHIPTAVYWTMRGVVACEAQITSLTTMGHEFSISTTDAWELSTLAHKLSNILDHLRKQLDTCYQYIDEKRNVESFQMLKNLFEMIHIDNMKVLKALIYAKDDIQPLIDGSSKKRVHLDVLRRKNVLLLISGLDMSSDELSILEQIYNESRHHGSRLDSQYEVVWVPIVDRSVQWSDPMKEKFESMQSSMPWFTVYHPSLIEKAVMRFIKEVWHFRNKPILVVLDPQGKVVCPNALHMMWIWGSSAFPFTSLREESLWKDETWRLELLVDGIDPVILNWIKEGKLESMLYSKIQLGKLDDHDPMMQEIKKLLSYGREGRIHDISRPCCRFDFPMTTGRIPETMKCPECNQTMEKFSTFLCCHDEVIPDELFK
ncbi:hypothetical protein D5086_003012 [Populus alba]|uniref:Uncharacterized protein n=1 Tax=Populus alba TaxID=43335 RepID=A0ACC4D3D0_POPAL